MLFQTGGEWVWSLRGMRASNLKRTGPSPVQKPPRRRRNRRSTEEILERILTAASEEFEKNGYTSATTSAIALKAGVAESLIFSNFGSKAKLFYESIFRPLQEHLVSFCDTHMLTENIPAQSKEEFRIRYIRELQEFVERHSQKFISLFVAQIYGHESSDLSDLRVLQDYFEKALAISMKNRKTKAEFDPKIVVRLSFATIFSSIIFRNWLFPEGMSNKEEIDSTLTAFVIDGLNINSIE
jgi:AcrR family transcriptional regulator